MLEAALFLSAAVLGWALVLGIRRWAPSLGLLDLPTERGMHSRVTPRGGGIAIVSVTVIGIAVVAILGTRPEWPAFSGYLAGALVIVLVSLVDDIRALPAGVRLAAQAVAAAFMVAALATRPALITSAGQSVSIWLVIGVAFLWTVGLTNAYNFMDGIDGLAATQGVLAGLAFALLASLNAEPWLAILAFLLAAACIGFAFHNWSPAHIFMGDVGSAFLGFTFAFIALAASRSINQFVSGVLVMWPFIFDTGITFVRRLRQRENLLVAHRSHLYQRLVLAGRSHSSVTSLYGFFAVVTLGAAVVWWLPTSTAARLLALAVVVSLSGLLWGLVARSEHARGLSEV